MDMGRKITGPGSSAIFGEDSFLSFVSFKGEALWKPGLAVLQVSMKKLRQSAQEVVL
jgi:hypothetical protein